MASNTTGTARKTPIRLPLKIRLPAALGTRRMTNRTLPMIITKCRITNSRLIEHSFRLNTTTRTKRHLTKLTARKSLYTRIDECLLMLRGNKTSRLKRLQTLIAREHIRIPLSSVLDVKLNRLEPFRTTTSKPRMEVRHRFPFALSI